MTTQPRTLTTDELGHILQGACFLGSGGGGPLALGLQFIDDIAKAANPVRVVDVAKELDIPMSTASRLLKGLSDRGYLLATTHPRGYIPGFEVSRIAKLGSGHYDSYVQALRTRLAELIRTTEYATGCIATLQGTDIQIVDVVDATAPPPAPLRRAARA